MGIGWSSRLGTTAGIVLLFPSLSACGSASPTPETAANQAGAGKASGDLNFNGIYVSESIDPTGTQIGWDYIRFFEDGNVVTLSTPAPAEAILHWLDPQDPHPAKGMFALQGAKVTFSATSQLGTVDYEGQIDGPGLLLAWRSRINGGESGGQYVFVPVVSDEEATPQPATPAVEEPTVVEPPKTGRWSCTRPTAKSPTTSYCGQDAEECNSYRKLAVAKYPRAKMSPCEPQETAFCRSLGSFKNAGETCYASLEECTQSTRRGKKNAPPAECVEH